MYIHIGSPKAGSTSIQDFLYTNRNNLEINDFYFPKITNDHLKSHNGYKLQHAIDDNSKDKNSVIKFYKSKIDKSKASNIIISYEGFTNPSFNTNKIKELKNNFKEYNIKIIIYIRRSVDFFVSAWQHSLKHNFTGANVQKLKLSLYLLETTLEKRFSDVISSYSNIFGIDNIILKPFEKEQFKNNDLINDFLDTIGIENIKYSNNIEKKNESLNISVCKIAYYFGFLNFKSFISNDIYQNLLDISATDKEDGKPIELLSNEEIKNVCDKNYPFECKLAKEFLGRNELFVNKYPSLINDKNRKPKPFEAKPEYWKVIDLAFMELTMQRFDEIEKQKLFSKLKRRFINLIHIFVPGKKIEKK